MNRRRLSQLAQVHLLTLPERVVRACAAVAGGLLKELGEVTLPRAVKQSRLYENLVGVALRFLIEEVGQVKGVYEPGETTEVPGSDFLVRRTVGNFVELVGVLAFRMSPVWLFAALADASGAGRSLLRDIVSELVKEGVLEEVDAEGIETTEQLLDAVERAAERLARTTNTPPLDLEALKAEWEGLRQDIGRLKPEELPQPQELWRRWQALKAEAERQGVPVMALSAALSLSAMNRAGRWLILLPKATGITARYLSRRMVRLLLEHYDEKLEEIRRRGYFQYWKEQFSPYLRAAAEHLAQPRAPWTEKVLRFVRRRPAVEEPGNWPDQCERETEPGKAKGSS